MPSPGCKHGAAWDGLADRRDGTRFAIQPGSDRKIGSTVSCMTMPARVALKTFRLPWAGCSRWSKSGTGKRHPYYLCQSKRCPSYGKSIRRDRLEGDFEALLQRLTPSVRLFAIVKDMLGKAWDHRLSQADAFRKALRTGMLKTENQIGLLLDRIVETSSAATAAPTNARSSNWKRQAAAV